MTRRDREEARTDSGSEISLAEWLVCSNEGGRPGHSAGEAGTGKVSRRTVVEAKRALAAAATALAATTGAFGAAGPADCESSGSCRRRGVRGRIASAQQAARLWQTERDSTNRGGSSLRAQLDCPLELRLLLRVHSRIPRLRRQPDRLMSALRVARGSVRRHNCLRRRGMARRQRRSTWRLAGLPALAAASSCGAASPSSACIAETGDFAE